MNDNAKISVIIPVYNSARYLTHCLNSVLHQTLMNIEIICIDDASTDGSLRILEEYSSNHECIRLIKTETNRGQAYARNEGIKYAKGTYLYFIDADDFLSNKKSLAMLYESAQQNDVDGVVFDADIIYENDELKEKWCAREYLSRNIPEGVYNGRILFESLVKRGDFLVGVWLQFWKRDYILKNGIKFCEVTAPGEDLLYSLKTYCLSDNIYYLKRRLYTYRVRDGSSQTIRFSEKRMRAFINTYYKSLAFIIESNVSDITPYLSFLNEIRIHINNHFYLMPRVYDQNPDDIAVRFLCESSYTNIRCSITELEYTAMKNADRIIVYGAGNVAREVVSILTTYGFYEYDVAVSKKKKDTEFGGKRVYEIKELKKYAFNSVVIIAASSIYSHDMEKTAIAYGFDKIIKISAKKTGLCF